MAIHIDFLVEDFSCEVFLNTLFSLDGIRTLFSSKNISFKIKSYGGLGSKITIKDVSKAKEYKKKTLLENLFKVLDAYGKTFYTMKNQVDSYVFVICDLDDKNETTFRMQLESIISQIDPAPTTKFILAIEELEAWLLGDISAIRKAYPKAKGNILNTYQNDSICGTWEILAFSLCYDVKKLKNGKYAEIGSLKKEWAEKITQNFNINNNLSPSFNNFINELISL